MESVYQVDFVSLKLLKTNPPSLQINCTGTASTSGWTEVQLSRVEYVHPPLDGIQDFNLMGKAPAGIPLEVLTPVEAETFVMDIPDWLKGVRVHAVSNIMYKILPEKTQ